ncbi:hypothetical protein [Actinoplanes awajinensis]|nr:hypothetical protein [Actinoplanes awajinensis]
MLTFALVALALLFGIAIAIAVWRRGNSGSVAGHGPARRTDRGAERSDYENSPRYSGDAGGVGGGL